MTTVGFDYFTNGMNAPFDEFAKNMLSIITYNYDRSVEHFFMTSLQNTYGRNVDDCLPLVNAIPIIHLHGSLGPLPWQVKAGEPNRPYDYQISRENFEVSRTHIKIIHEDVHDGRDADFARAKQFLTDAQQIFFLGFGYNRINLERLGVGNLDKTVQTILGTCVGLGGADRAQVFKDSLSRIDLITDVDCYGMISERLQWQ